MDYSAKSKSRFQEARSGLNGKPTFDWQLTDTKLVDSVRLTIPPTHVLPIIFVPGIMGSNLCNLRGEPVWLLNSVKKVPIRLAWDWARRGAGERQAILHPLRTMVYKNGEVPEEGIATIRDKREYLSRGWGEVSEASYHEFLLWLEMKMNGERNPSKWRDFSHAVASSPTHHIQADAAAPLPPGIAMRMHGLAENAEADYPTAPVMSDDLLKRSKFNFPVYAFGYNWLASNKLAAAALLERIDRVIAKNNVGIFKCTQVVLVTHSMGGLVARACSALPGVTPKIAGVVHGVMPAVGAAVAYRRCKVGMRDEDFKAGLVIGSDGQEVTAVFAQAAGALQLLPSEEYGPHWLKLDDENGQMITSLPAKDPYEEIYLCKDKWWGLVSEEWLHPKDGVRISWKEFADNISLAKEFHRGLSKKYHPRTFVFYGGGEAEVSFATIRWSMRKGINAAKGRPPLAASVPMLNYSDIRTDGSNKIYIGGEPKYEATGRTNGIEIGAPVRIETSFWELRCERQDSAGDGTVPLRSGQAPRQAGAFSVYQQFRLSGVRHEPAFKNPTAQQVTQYALTKIVAMARLL